MVLMLTQTDPSAALHRSTLRCSAALATELHSRRARCCHVRSRVMPPSPCAAAITSARTRSAALHQVQLCIEPSLFLCRLHSSSDVVRTVAMATTSEESVRRSSMSRRAAAADSFRRQASERVAHHAVRTWSTWSAFGALGALGALGHVLERFATSVGSPKEVEGSRTDPLPCACPNREACSEC